MFLLYLPNGQLDVTPIIGGTWGLEDWHEAFETMHDGRIVKSLLSLDFRSDANEIASYRPSTQFLVLLLEQPWQLVRRSRKRVHRVKILEPRVADEPLAP